MNEAHRLAATNLDVPASTIVTQARQGKDDAFHERSPHEESDAKKLKRRRFDGPLAQMNDKAFHDSLIFLSPTGLRLLFTCRYCGSYTVWQETQKANIIGRKQAPCLRRRL